MIDKSPVRLPRWLPLMNGVIKALQKIGIPFFVVEVLSIPGRKTGRMRATPVSPFIYNGSRYVLSFGELDWVRNARTAKWGILSRGRRQSKVSLVETFPPESTRIAGEFPRQIPRGAPIFVQLGLVAAPGGPEEFEAAADGLVLFRLDRIIP